MGRVKQPDNALSLRTRCRDLGLNPSWSDEDGKRFFMSVSEMIDAIKQMELAAKGAKKYRAGGKHVFPRTQDAHLFWSSSTPPLDRPTTLPNYVQLGLLSAVKNSGLRVHLWCYGPLVGVPCGVQMMSAAVLVPLQDAHSFLEKGLRIQHLADVVRFKACGKSTIACVLGRAPRRLTSSWLRF